MHLLSMKDHNFGSGTQMKISYQSEKVAMLEKILMSLETRGFQIKNAIDFERMMGGPI